jgi:hypothetical protein
MGNPAVIALLQAVGRAVLSLGQAMTWRSRESGKRFYRCCN